MRRYYTAFSGVYLKNVADGKPTRRRYAHMHMTKLLGINAEVAKQPWNYFAFVPPLAVVSSDNLRGPKSISLDDIDAEFVLLEDIRNAEKTMDTEFALDCGWKGGFGRETLQNCSTLMRD
ncbi:hypothetical protein F4604DRAFT_1734813 [Suillus subluteus]|nr:hypothetical protein F4604DRAFT_1734813 [Suillus subluteus]